MASANVNANEMSAVPLPVDTLKKNSAKKGRGGEGRGGGGVHVGSTILFLGRISAFIYECIHAQEKKNKNKQAKELQQFPSLEMVQKPHQLTTSL